nr:mlp-like protein 328 [Quercus suber]POF19200.1 mlp-like protein 328 [Quercus suber]
MATLLFSFEPTEGNVETFKEKVEADVANKKVTLTALEGHCLDLYKTYKVIYQVAPKSDGGSVKVTIEHKKLNENVPPPTKYIDFIVNLFKDIDTHALKA